MSDSFLPRPDRARSADDVDGLIRHLYGPDANLAATGVLHLTSVWRGPEGDAPQGMTLRIGEHTPRSLWDLVSLGLARARADAIMTSGRILRMEPTLHHGFVGPGDLPRALLDWRRRQGRDQPPISLVMTRSGELDFTHPLFHGSGRVIVYTSERGAWRLDSRAADAGVEVEIDPEPSVRAALRFIRGAFGCATVSIEAGPSIARGLYEEPITVDELLLSTYLGSQLPTAARGGRQIPHRRIERHFRRPAPAVVTRADDGQDDDWRFERFVR
ncbi:MAG: hypothetical protein AAGM22_19500 [Acidobacteriota bacterium]